MASVGVGLLVAAGSASAGEAEMKYRQSVMKALGGHTSALAAIVKNEVDYADDAGAHAAGIARLANILPHVFPEGSGGPDSDSLPAVWDKPEAFDRAMQEFETAATDLARAAEKDPAPEALAPAFSQVAKSCKGCHDDFRKKD
jgi:cytochrome c556